MTSSAILAFYLVLFVLQRVVESGLGVLNLRHGRAQDAPPPALAGAVDGDTHARMRDYTQTRGRFALLTDSVSAVAVLAVVLSGVLGTLDRAVGELALHPYLSGGLYVLAVGAFFTVLGIPASLYSQFVIEQRFGFNRTTLRLFLLDRLKGGLISPGHQRGRPAGTVGLHGPRRQPVVAVRGRRHHRLPVRADGDLPHRDRAAVQPLRPGRRRRGPLAAGGACPGGWATACAASS